MIRIDIIFEEDEAVRHYLISHQILDQYKKTKLMLLSGYAQKYDFKRRQPKSSGIYQFRINQKYRAFAKLREEGGRNVLIVYMISDHQDF